MGSTSLSYFHKSVQDWFLKTFESPTEVQKEAWPSIAENNYTLISAPTGSGKTLAAFLLAIDSIVKEALNGDLPQETQVVYISPLKALGNDIDRNLQFPIKGITEELKKSGHAEIKIRTAVRTGDTTASERALMLKVPPHILVTTPESLYLLLTSVNGRKMLSHVRTVIVDEIHAMADDKRGSHLSLSLERLENLVEKPLKRIGLSATQKPIEKVASFLTGNRENVFCKIVDSIHKRDYDLDLVLPFSPLSSVMSNEVWTEIHQKLVNLINEHKTTIIFVNTRRLAERLTHSLSEFIAADEISAHHGSMSKKHRETAEQKLKAGKLKAVVATASLELGIDIGSVDLMVQISSPRSISTFIQRLGRSRHFVNGKPKGRLIPLTLSDLLECTALLDSVKKGELDELVIPEKPLDVLAQQIVAEVSGRNYQYAELFHLIKKSYSYRNLSEKEFEEIIETLAKGYATSRGRAAAYIYFDKVNMTIKARKSARLIALTNGGVIPDSFDFDVVLEPENTVVGTVNEDFATESLAGDVFQLGNSSWRIKKITAGKVYVEDAHGQPPDMPFWLGEAPGRSNELSLAVSGLIKEFSKEISSEFNLSDAVKWMQTSFNLEKNPAEQLANYLALTKSALGHLPDENTVILERFFDQAGDMHLVVHSVFGMRVNKAWGLALRKRICRKFNFELQAAANENTILLSLGPTHSFPLEEVFSYLNDKTVKDKLVQALLDSPLFGVRWRWAISNALALVKRRGGKRIPPQLQRMQAEDLIALIFPDQLACLENIQGDREIPDHPLVNQTISDCLNEAMDISKLIEILKNIRSEKINTIAVDLREPSPMAQDALAAQPYAFLDNAPIEERRVHAVYSRRWSGIEEASSMAQLDPEAIQKVIDEAWPLVRDADELAEALSVSSFLTEQELKQKGVFDTWKNWFDELLAQNRATKAVLPGSGYNYWVPVERLPEIQRVFPELKTSPYLHIPDSILHSSQKIENPLLELVRSRLGLNGPVNTEYLVDILPVKISDIEQVLIALEVEGYVFRGQFTSKTEEWCERRLLARIHRYTIDKLRSAVQPVSPSQFMHFLFHWQKVVPRNDTEGLAALKSVLDQLEGYDAQSVSWEGDIFPLRIKEYSYTWLDLLLLTGDYSWGKYKNGKTEPASTPGATIRTTPITFVKQANLKFYQHSFNLENINNLHAHAKRVYELLKSQGAQFFAQLEARSGLFSSQIEEALTTLISLGIVSSDSFTGLRTLLIPDKYYTSRRRANRISFNFQQAGRWWLIPSADNEENIKESEEYLQYVAMMLLKRYGVVFRKIAEKEKLLSIWYGLLKTYRRMEASGIIRGGRFIEGFGGEHYALPDAVTLLRNIKDQESDSLVSISAADPLNLTGYVVSGKRIPSIYTNRLLFRNGILLAVKEGREVTFVNSETEQMQWELKKKLIQHEIQPELRPYLTY